MKEQIGLKYNGRADRICDCNIMEEQIGLKYIYEKGSAATASTSLYLQYLVQYNMRFSQLGHTLSVLIVRIENKSVRCIINH